MTRSIYNINKRYETYIKIESLQYVFKAINFYNYIIENDGNTNEISIIKIINEELPFNDFCEINPNLNISSEEKYIINENNEISIGIKISKENNKTIYNPGTPIIIKKENKKYLIGIIDMENNYYIFSKKELLDIKTKIDIIEMKDKFTQIEKLDFTNKEFNNNDIIYIFQYNFNKLEYLNLEKNNITNEGLTALQNISLEQLKYLDLGI